MNPIKSMFYDEARYEYFKRQKSIAEGKLKWWESRLNSPNYPDHYVEDRCAEYGSIISYYSDVIGMLERLACLDELSANLEDDRK